MGGIVLHLPTYTPELNPIELIFQLLDHCLCHSNPRHLSPQMKCGNFFLLKCLEVPESIPRQDIVKMYKKCGYIVQRNIKFEFVILFCFFLFYCFIVYFFTITLKINIICIPHNKLCNYLYVNLTKMERKKVNDKLLIFFRFIFWAPGFLIRRDSDDTIDLTQVRVKCCKIRLRPVRARLMSSHRYKWKVSTAGGWGYCCSKKY